MVARRLQSDTGPANGGRFPFAGPSATFGRIKGGSRPKVSARCAHKTPYFKVGGVGFGVEICGDHNDQSGLGGTLKQWNAQAGKSIDIHILISDSNFVQTKSVAARPGGFVVQCDISGIAAGVAAFPSGGPYNADHDDELSSTTDDVNACRPPSDAAYTDRSASVCAPAAYSCRRLPRMPRVRRQSHPDRLPCPPAGRVAYCGF